MKDNQELVNQAKQGDTHAFAELYEQIYEDLYRYAIYMLKNKSDAEDMVAETVLVAFESIHKLRNAASFRSWMFQILTNRCRKMRRRYTNREEELPETLESHNIGLEEMLDVKNALMQISLKERQIIGLFAIAGYKSSEIGELMHMNPATVRSKMSRGLGKMKKYLS